MADIATDPPSIDVSADRETLHRDGIVALKCAFSRDWTERMREDMMTAFWEAIQRPGGAVGRGPRRWYGGDPALCVGASTGAYMASRKRRQ